MKTLRIFICLITILCLICTASLALTLTDDPATMVPISMLAAQWCRDQEMDYWETFWIVTTFSVAKEVADQAAGNSFDSGHIGLNLLGMTFSWFIFDF
ncbi:hypothetical protein ACFL5G_00230 [Candidatus Margulisiibacteriota bacterium]